MRSLAESAKRKSDAPEEKNTINVFSQPDSAGREEAKEFFAAMLQVYLTRALKKARLTRKENVGRNSEVANADGVLNAAARVPIAAPAVDGLMTLADQAAPLTAQDPIIVPPARATEERGCRGYYSRYFCFNFCV